LGVGRSDTIKLEEYVLRLEYSHSTMVSPVGKSSSSSTEEGTSKPEKKGVEPLTSLSAPLKEVRAKIAKTAKTADKALDWEICGAKAIQYESVAVLENGMYLSPQYSDRNGYTYSPDASFFNVFPPSDQQVSEYLRTDRRRIR
jgi:hypothetical protein